MEAWRQWPLGGRKNVVSPNKTRNDLTPPGLLMEGRYTQVPSGKAMMSTMGGCYNSECLIRGSAGLNTWTATLTLHNRNCAIVA
jgi:hypothetical protein